MSQMHELDKFGTIYHKYDGEVSKLYDSRLILKDIVEKATVLENYFYYETGINTVFCLIGHKAVFRKFLKKNYLRITGNRKIKVGAQLLSNYVSVCPVLLFGHTYEIGRRC